MKTLSKSEALVMEEIEESIKPLEVAGILGCSLNQARVVLHRLDKKGWLLRVKRGLYIHPERIVNPYHLLPLLSKKYYVSYFTALNYHGFTTQVPTSLLVASLDTSLKIKFHNTSIKFIKVAEKKFFGFKKIKIKNKDIAMAEKEKALLDSLDKPQYSGGINHVIPCFENEFNTKKLIRYALKLDNRTLIRRLGAILDQKEIELPPSLEEKMLKISNEAGYYSPLDKTRKINGKKIKKWRIRWNVR